MVHLPSHCTCYQKEFDLSDVVQTVQKHQIFDFPRPKIEVVQYKLGVIPCCCQRHVSSFPDGVNTPVQYGVKVKAMVSLLCTDYRMPLDKIRQLFVDLYGQGINESSIINAHGKLYQALEPTQSALLDNKAAHFDETGLRVEGKLNWLHMACHEKIAYLFIHSKRGKQALYDSDSVLKDYQGRAIHDGWRSYFDNCKHG